MAIVLFPGNSVGIGHLSRAFRVCQVLSEDGYRPVIISQGSYPAHFAKDFPGTSVTDLWKADPARMNRRLLAILRFTHPSIFMEDTYPTRVPLDTWVTRVLIVRPIDFHYLRWLREKFSERFNWFLMADHPESPTWPYSRDETAEIESWSECRLGGPIFRVASENGIHRVQQRYKLQPDQDLYVFTMGGGGVHDQGKDDVPNFIKAATALCHRLRTSDPSCRLLFIRGPLFPASAELPHIFESVDEEPLMPELLRVAAGAVIRPGFNTIWECLSAGTPFVPIVGTTYAEPVGRRLARLRDLGVLSEENIENWTYKAWRIDFRERIVRLSRSWEGKPDRDILREIISSGRRLPQRTAAPQAVSRAAVVQTEASSISRPLPRLAVVSGKKKLAIRVDDVAQIDETLVWVLAECRKRQFPASLEVIPYLSHLTEQDLNELDRGSKSLEVSQHGFAHIPQVGPTGMIGEYVGEVPPIPRYVGENLARGYRYLCGSFPNRFRAGFSPPYDGLPGWLPCLWKSIGGRYLSLIHPGVANPEIAVVRVAVDCWEWIANKPRPLRAVLRQIESEVLKVGYAGLVVHPQVIWDRGEFEYFVALLDMVAEAGISGCTVSSLA